MSALAKSDANNSSLTEMERQFQRVKLSLFGRYMLSDKREFPCQITDMSPGSATIIGPRSGDVGERVIAYMDHIGRLEGTVLRVLPGGFVINLVATAHKRDKLAAKITWLANRHELTSPEDRRHERVAPTNKLAEIKMEDGRTYRARIIDLSLSGAAFEIEVRPAIGTLIWLGNLRGRVVRHFDEGIAVEFAILQNRDTLQQFTASQPQT